LCLVINKIDRLILELRLSPLEAYDRLEAIIAHVNMIVSSFQSENFLSEADAVLAHEISKAGQGADSGSCRDLVDGVSADNVLNEEGEEEDEEDMFSPIKGNVAFASAYDGWAFQIDQFAELYAAKLGCKPSVLRAAMWGDFTLNSKTKRITRIKRDQRAAGVKPLFVTMALEPLWKAYAACDASADHVALLTKIVQGLQLTRVSERMIQHGDARSALRSVLRRWLPLSEAVLGMATLHLPSPKTAAPLRANRLLSSHKTSSITNDQVINSAAIVANCSTSEEAETIVYVSKMVAIPAHALPRIPGEPGPPDPLEPRFLAFGRVFSGVLRSGQKMYILPPDYSYVTDPTALEHADHDSESPLLVDVGPLYLMMGRGLEKLDSVPAGNVLAIAGLDQAILKSATLSSTLMFRPLAPLSFQSAPIVRVAVEPVHPGDMGALEQGLHLLHRADPLVQVDVMENGEHVVAAAGEVHLETCIKDLQDRFAKVPLHVSAPLVAFRETVVDPEEEEDARGGTTRVVEVTTPGGNCCIRVRAIALSAPLTSVLDQSVDIFKSAFYSSRPAGTSDLHLSGIGQRLLDACRESTGEKKLLQNIWMLGPKRHGPNLLLSSASSSTESENFKSNHLCQSLWTVPSDCVIRIGGKKTDSNANIEALNALKVEDEGDAVALDEVLKEAAGDGSMIEMRVLDLLGGQPPPVSQELGLVDGNCFFSTQKNSQGRGNEGSDLVDYITHSVQSGISAGFQLATAAGPLCDEPMWGVAFQVEARISEQIPLLEDVYGPMSGQVTSAARQAFRRSLLEAGPRLAEAAFLCEISTSSEGLAPVYAVLGRRRGRVLREEMREGSDVFSIHAYLPAEASFGFANELRRRSSGAASASLMLSHWERLQVDPFFVPLTEEQREEFGEEGQGMGAPNLAKKLIDSVRRRKGLPVEQKVVESATRQRTRARKV
jgi:ribosome assembly protein 1